MNSNVPAANATFFIGAPSSVIRPPPTQFAATAEQRQPDDQDDGAGDQRREEPDQLREERRQHHHEDAAGDHRAVDGADAVLRADDDHRRDRGEGAALHQRHSDAEPLEADGLDEGGDAGDEQVRRDQVAKIVGVQFAGRDQRAADHQRHRDRTGVQRQHVLQAERDQLPPGRQFVHGFERPAVLVEFRSKAHQKCLRECGSWLPNTAVDRRNVAPGRCAQARRR